MKKIILLFICQLSFVSCNKWLDVTPDGSISDKDLFSNGYGFHNALNGIYLNLAQDALYGKELKWGFVSAISQEYYQNEDNVYLRGALYAEASGLLYGTEEAKNILKGIWEQGYKEIANINKLIGELEATKDSYFEEGKPERDLIYGESLALRAMIHFDLLRLFAPAPVNDDGGKYIPYRTELSASDAAKLTVDETLKNILVDYTKARSLIKEFDIETHPEGMYASSMYSADYHWNARVRFLSSTFAGASLWKSFFWYRGTRINYMAVLGLMARVFLYEGDYDKANSMATELFDDYHTDRQWVGFNTASSINASMTDRFTKVLDDVLFGIYEVNLSKDYEDDVYSTSNSLVTCRIPLARVHELFASDNNGIYEDYRLKYLIKKADNAGDQYYSLKYDSSSNSEIESLENPIVPVIRLSEICYILAETEARRGDLNKAMYYLTVVRKSRGALRDLSLTVKDYEGFMDELVLDMRKEFIGEGELFFQYKRLNFKEIPYGSGNGTIPMSGKWVMPVPESENLI